MQANFLENKINLLLPESQSDLNSSCNLGFIEIFVSETESGCSVDPCLILSIMITIFVLIVPFLL